MTIDRVGSIDPIQGEKRAGRTENIRGTADSDSIALSTEALEKGNLFQAVELVSSAPDLRLDKIEELKKKINDSSYINDTIVSATAEKIMDAFGL